MCAAVYDNYSIVARAASLGLSSIGQGLSLNNNGVVAFTGTGAQGTGLYAGDGATTPVKNINPSFTGGTRKFSSFVQINDSNIVAAGETMSTGGTFSSFVRTWSVATGAWTIVGKGTSTASPGVSFNLVNLPSINNKGAVAYTATKTAASDNQQYLELSTGGEFAIGMAPIALREQIADDGSVVFRAGNLTTSPLQVSRAGRPGTTIASPADGFSAIGQSPGIADDGRKIVFYGVVSAEKARAIGATAGAGIFIYDTSSKKLTCLTSGTGAQLRGVTIKGLEADTRVAINALEGVTGAYQVVFLGRDADGRSGIFATVFRDVPRGQPGGVPIASTRVVLKVGDSVTATDGGGALVVASLGINDSTNAKGQVAMWVADASGLQAVVRADTLKALDFSKTSLNGVSPTNEQWDSVLQSGYSLAIARAYTGLGADATAVAQLANARKRGLLTAAYTFMRFDDPKTNGKAQVDQAISALGGEAAHIQFLAIDVEEFPGRPVAAGVSVTDFVKQAIDQCVAKGFRAVLYTNKNWWRDKAANSAAFTGVSLWQADINGTRPFLEATGSTLSSPLDRMWRQDGKQYRFDSTAVIPRVKVDDNVFRARVLG
ncbi:MAG: GH25 family lysozyme [Planctomycetia bacterium]